MPTRPPILRITAPGWTQECDSGTHALVWRPGEGARLTASEDDGVVRFRHVAGWWLTVTDPAVTCRLDGELVDGGGRRRLAEGEARALVLSRRGDRDQVLSLAVGAAGAGGGPRRAITTPEAKPVRGRAKTPRVRPGPEAAAAPEARFGQGSLTLDFEQRYVVGSGDVDVRLSGADVAERHLQVRRRPAFVEVRSLSPLYYPIVDGSPCVYARLQDGGSMLVGHHRLTVSGGRLLWNTPLPLTHALEIRDLALRYRGKSSAELQGFSLTAEAGEVTAIVGPSGHGKTTLFRGLLGQVRNYSGSASLGRIDLLAFGSQVSHLVSFVPQATELFAELTVRDTLRYAARLRFDASARPDDVATAITRTMEQVHLSELADTRVSRLSGGERHRVSLALELLTEPTLLMLDEPTADLDAGLEPDLIGILEDFAASGHIVLLVTHSLHSLAPDTTISALARQTKEAPAFEAYAGALKGLAPRLRVDTHAQAMDKLRHWTDQVPVPVERGRVAEQPRDAEVSEPRKPKPEGIRRTRILTAREFRRNLTQWPSITSSALLYSGITLLLSYVSAASGMVGGGNGGTRIAILIMSTCFAFFSLSFSFSSIVADRDMIRREALWGVPASSVIVSRFIIYAPVAVFVPCVVVPSYFAVRDGPVDPLFSPVLAITGIGVALCLCSVAVGLLISTVATRLKQTVLVLMAFLALEVVLSGMTVPLTGDDWPDKLLRVISYLMPTRWAGAAWAAETGLIAVPEDPLWFQDAAHYLRGIGCLVGLTVAALALATLKLRHDLRRKL